MAATIPQSLKSADITRFVHRAAQLKQANPVVAYWCNFWVLTQILNKELHTTDADALAFTTGLMDRVEQFKSQNAANDAVTDDVAGKAYVEQFGSETFVRADNAVRANKATLQTADTFQAAATFLELLEIWGEVEAEIQAKVKYAKFHALRIAKAIKAGEDPNLSNPKPEPAPEENLPTLDPNDAEVQALQGDTSAQQPSVVDVPDETHRLQAHLARTSSLDQSLHPSRDPSAVRQQRQPSVVEIPDQSLKDQNRLARQSTKDESLHPSRAPSMPRPENGAVSPLAPTDEIAAFYTGKAPSEISPMEPPASDRKPSIGGNYFPVVAPSQPSPPMHLPSAPPDNTNGAPGFVLPSAPSEPSLPAVPTTFSTDIPPSSNINPEGHFAPPPPPDQNPQIPPNLQPSAQTPRAQFQAPAPAPAPEPQWQPNQQGFTAPGSSYAFSQPAPNLYRPPGPTMPVPPSVTRQQQQQPSAPAPSEPVSSSNVVVDEEAILRAQKHARWAISALNFEDVNTAIRELQGALKVLGAR